jgi:type II secretory pathway pseudopilin PulG
MRRPDHLGPDGVSAGWIRAARAFSLVELMVVIGLVVLLAGGVGLALNDTGGSSLATAQTTLASAVNLARSQAAVNQTETLLAIHAQPPPPNELDRYLKVIQVFRSTTPGSAFASATWEPVGNPLVLPRGVYVVPPTISGLLAPNVVWPTNPPQVSSLGATVTIPRQPAGTMFAGTLVYALQFNPDGTFHHPQQSATATTTGRLVVGTAVLANSRPQFNNAAAVRGLLIRPTGAITFVNEAIAF